VALALALIAAQFAWRSYRTHRVFNDTADEEPHLLAGLEVWEHTRYTLEPQHPPLARVVLAALPYTAGLRSSGKDSWQQRDEEFYWRTLSLARAANLLFLPLLIACAWRWGRELNGQWGGLGAAALVGFSPNLLAHASLATLDFAAAATMFAACFNLWWWSQDPRGTGNWLVAAVSTALAVLTKFSALLVLPVTAAVFFVAARGWPGFRRWILWVVTSAVLVWAGYGFSVGPLPRAQFAAPPGTWQAEVQRWVEQKAGKTRLPAPQFVRGVLDVAGHDAQGHQSYLLGEVRQRGRWYYFPVALALKSTLPLLILAAAGLLAGRNVLFPALAAGALLAVCMASNLNLGVRHILPVYPLLAVVGGSLLASRRKLVVVAACALTGWHAWEGVAAHPDYLTYFNQSVRGREAEYLLDSNLDWGQDLERLRRYLEDERVTAVYLSFFGRGEPIRRRIPGVRPLPPNLRPAGWVAVSQAHLAGLALPGYNLGWLKGRQPRARIGKSILVYYFP